VLRAGRGGVRGGRVLVGRSTLAARSSARYRWAGVAAPGPPSVVRCDTGAMTHENLLDGPAPTLLPVDGADAVARAALAAGSAPRDVVPAAPAASLVWALLAERADDPVVAYAYARTGYHRGLDALRGAGWRGRGPVPVAHVPNQGFLRAVLALAGAADAIGEAAEGERCRRLLEDCGTSADEVAALR